MVVDYIVDFVWVCFVGDKILFENFDVIKVCCCNGCEFFFEVVRD